MEMPKVSNVAKDEQRNITFNIMAYRQLSEAEVLRAVRYFRSTKEGRKIKKNMTYTIISTVGARD